MSEINDAKQSAVKHEDVKTDEKLANSVEENGDEKKGQADDSAIADESLVTEKSDANAGDDEDSGSDSDESLPPGLLERPVEILDQKRARKKITRFSYDDEKSSPSGEKKSMEIPKGTGVCLRQHPRVEYQLQRNTAEDLKVLHKFFYGVPGTNFSVKKNIREFCGFVMEKDSGPYQKKEEFLGKFTVDNLKWAMSVCDVIVKGNKDELIDAFMEWCLCPKPQNKPVPESKRKKDKPGQKIKKKVKRSAKKMENGDSTTDAGGSPKKAKISLKKKKTKDRKSSEKKTAKIKITSPKSKSKVDDDVTSSSDDEPLVQKKKTPPTNEEIRKYIEELLKDADLEVLTMKVVFQQVYEHYPEFDITDRKAFIKETVKSIIS